MLTGTSCSSARRPCPDTWSAWVCVSSVRTMRTSRALASSRYCSIANAGSTTTAVPVPGSPTRYEAHPSASSTNCVKITRATLAAGVAISLVVSPARSADVRRRSSCTGPARLRESRDVQTRKRFSRSLGATWNVGGRLSRGRNLRELGHHEDPRLRSPVPATRFDRTGKPAGRQVPDEVLLRGSDDAYLCEGLVLGGGQHRRVSRLAEEDPERKAHLLGGRVHDEDGDTWVLAARRAATPHE